MTWRSHQTFVRRCRRALPLGVLPMALADCGGRATDTRQTDTTHVQDGASPTVVMYKTPTCACCSRWAEHMRTNGFRVATLDTDDLASVRAARGVSGAVASCHTTVVGGYVVEGHVPVGDVRRLLRERPPVIGIAAPGMPLGAPGMEGPYRTQDYTVLAFDRSGAGWPFARHR